MKYSNIKFMSFLLFMNIFIFSFSTNSFYFLWVCFELNMMMYIPLMKKLNQHMSTSMMKYFIIQAISSNIFLMCILLMNYKMIQINNQISYLFFLSLWMKLGFFPFQNWYFQISETMDWMMWFWLNTLQKIIPIWILSFKILNNSIIYLLIILNSIFSMIEILNQTSLRWMINASSLNHFSWILFSFNLSNNIWEMYFTIYFFLFMMMILMIKYKNWNSLSNFFCSKNLMMNFIFITILMNFMGVPPFLGFLPKLAIMMYTNSFYLTSILLFNNVILSFMYLKFLIPLLILNKTKMNLYCQTKNLNSMFLVISITSLFLNLNTIF